MAGTQFGSAMHNKQAASGDNQALTLIAVS
jgi:hypothetical protein